MTYTEMVALLLNEDNKPTGNKLPAKVRAHFLPHVVPDIGLIPITSSRITDCIKKLSTMTEETIPNHDTGLEIGEALAAIKLLYRLPRNVFYTPGSKCNRYKGLTPMLMYALREMQQIPYSFWDTEDDNMGILMGESMWQSLANYTVPDFWDVHEPKWSKEELIEQRALHLKTKKEEDWNIGKDVDMPNDSKMAKQIMLQLWVASPSERIEDAMILDVFDWDNIPEPLVDKLPKDDLGF